MCIEIHLSQYLDSTNIIGNVKCESLKYPKADGSSPDSGDARMVGGRAGKESQADPGSTFPYPLRLSTTYFPSVYSSYLAITS